MHATDSERASALFGKERIPTVERVDSSTVRNRHPLNITRIQKFLIINFCTQLADVVEETRMKMERLGLFKKVGVFVDVAKGENFIE